jgi:hypothetical protein
MGIPVTDVVKAADIEALLFADRIVLTVMFPPPLLTLPAHIGADFADGFAAFSQIDDAGVVLVATYCHIVQHETTS